MGHYTPDTHRHSIGLHDNDFPPALHFIVIEVVLQQYFYSFCELVVSLKSVLTFGSIWRENTENTLLL